VQDLKDDYLRNAEPVAKVAYDSKIHVVQHALGLHTAISRVQGSRLKAKHEIRIASVFRDAPLEFLRMIAVHELAHLKEKQHDKAFYKLCCWMEPQYHQFELDLRSLCISRSGRLSYPQRLESNPRFLRSVSALRRRLNERIRGRTAHPDETHAATTPRPIPVPFAFDVRTCPRRRGPRRGQAGLAHFRLRYAGRRARQRTRGGLHVVRLQGQRRRRTRRWSTDVDSRLGAQLDATLARHWSAVLQVVGEQGLDNSYRPRVEWANIKYQATPELALRVGRIALPCS
jgi:hypothetical protein